MKLNLKDQIAVITGSGRGIGRAIATMLAEVGAHVIVTARTKSQLQDVVDEITSTGGSAEAFLADLADEENILSLFHSVKKNHDRLDILVNNAGYGVYGPLADFATEDLDKVLHVNFRGTFLCCREAMKLMIPEKSGYIINISSVLGFKGYPDQSVYGGTKHGIMGITKSLAVEAQEHSIRASVISPGGVDTEMVRQASPDLNPEELMQPEDIAQAVEYLLSLSDRAAVDEIYIRRRNSKPF